MLKVEHVLFAIRWRTDVYKRGGEGGEEPGRDGVVNGLTSMACIVMMVLLEFSKCIKPGATAGGDDIELSDAQACTHLR